ncbi:MAG: L-seryl-tRNA(Sec) selenium transferase [Deltaproteobacteria bacterium]|jgi:L-seryl-tRNA(Ser) seleniumtransferase|nr:L-seryl-tRNA(Sec) selenium transferase [Deltaproteobacteria bacterium]
MSGPPEILKRIPKVEKVIGWALKDEDLQDQSHARLLKAARLVLSELRAEILERRLLAVPADQIVLEMVKKKTQDLNQARFKPLINATGVVLHTNLGRAPLAWEALERVRLTAQSYSNLEYDHLTGRRADRLKPVEELLVELTGSESALAVNNNAAALFLLMASLAKDRKVIVSRGELVEIGGSFRLSDIIEAAGVTLVEVGSTNQTRIDDYRRAATLDHVALILKVHASNFRQIGYASQVEIEELSALARAVNLPLVVDLGSGSLVDLEPLGINETTVKKALSAGADVVSFSGDKLLGGPQAGIIAGKRPIISQLKSHPLTRVARLDKMSLAALEATLLLAQDQDEGKKKIPVWRALHLTIEELKTAAIRLKRFLGPFPGLKLSVVPVDGQAGGGAAPESPLPSFAVAIESLVNNVSLLEEKLRRQKTPVVARISHDQLLLDVRTISPDEYGPLKTSLTAAWGEVVGSPVKVSPFMGL